MTSAAASSGTGTTLIVGLNPALQKRFVLPPQTSLIPGHVHRASHVQVGVGGKGQNVATALFCLHYFSMELVQFLGTGVEGDIVFHRLQNLSQSKATTEPELLQSKTATDQSSNMNPMQLTVRTQSALRTCTSIVARDTTTELVEPSGNISSQEFQELMDKVLDHSKLHSIDALCFMGSLPPGCPVNTYAQIYHVVASPGTLCLIDSVIGLQSLLEAIAAKKELQHRQHGSSVGGSGSTNSSGGSGNHSTMLKINADELCSLAGIAKATVDGGGAHPECLVTAIQSFVYKIRAARSALHAIAITDGPRPAYLVIMPLCRGGDNEIRVFQLPIAKLLERCDAEESSESSSVGGGWGQWTTERFVGIKREQPSILLYPIGAGDAVAAGTLAAWNCLLGNRHHSSSTPEFFPLLAPELYEVLTADSTTSHPSRTRSMLTSFAFGLACGSASCLQEQNSVLRISDVLQLFNREGRPLFLSSHMLLENTER